MRTAGNQNMHAAVFYHKILFVQKRIPLVSFLFSDKQTPVCERDLVIHVPHGEKRELTVECNVAPHGHDLRKLRNLRINANVPESRISGAFTVIGVIIPGRSFLHVDFCRRIQP